MRHSSCRKRGTAYRTTGATATATDAMTSRGHNQQEAPMATKDRYGTFRVTFEGRGGRRTDLDLRDRESEVREQALFFGPAYGKVVAVKRIAD
jgi:hypothetical protein